MDQIERFAAEVNADIDRLMAADDILAQSGLLDPPCLRFLFR